MRVALAVWRTETSFGELGISAGSRGIVSVCCSGVCSGSETGSSEMRWITFDGQKGLMPAPENAEIIFDDEKLMDIDKDIGETSKKSKSGKKAKTISTQENDHVKKSRKK